MAVWKTFFLKSLVLGVGLSASTVWSTLLSDSFTGTFRPVLKDALYLRSGDPFRVLGNPAWGVEKSALGMSSQFLNADANGLADGGSSRSLAVVLQQRKSDWSFGFFSVLPTAGQPVLDTGDEDRRASPWINLQKQLLYAANVSRRFDGWSVGLLVPVYFSATTQAIGDLDTDNVNMRTVVELEPSVSFGLGASVDLLQGKELSFFYKEASRAETRAVLNSNIPLISLDLNFAGRSSYAFDPRRFSVAYMSHNENGLSWGLQLRYSQWSQFVTPYIELTESSLSITDTRPEGQAKDSFEGGISVYSPIGSKMAWAASLFYKESPFSQIESYYDSDQLQTAAAFSRELAADWSFVLNAGLSVLNRGALYSSVGLGVEYRL